MLARPGSVGSTRSIEQNLKELQRARPECGNRAGQVQPPGADERLVIHVRDAVAVRLETLEPVFDRQRVMRAQILDVEDTAAQRLEDFHHLAQRRWIGTRKDTLFDPWIELRRLVLADAV